MTDESNAQFLLFRNFVNIAPSTGDNKAAYMNTLDMIHLEIDKINLQEIVFVQVDKHSLRSKTPLFFRLQ